MAKKYKSAKLLKPTGQPIEKPVSSFGKHANRLADAKKKKIQKLSQTQKRVLQSKKNNKMIKISKKAKKFALLDQEDQNGQGGFTSSLTHKGVNIKDLKRFDDINFNQSDLQNDQQFDDLQDKINFAGFQATDNLLQQKKVPQSQDRNKSSKQVYKQIIQKSKAYKLLRQDQYEANLQKAIELDEGFGEFVTQLKFRNRDQKLLQQLQNKDLEYDKLMNELRDDQRIVSNKIVQKNQKLTEKIRQKKNDQLNKLMKYSDDENDVRGWVNGQEEEDESQVFASQASEDSGHCGQQQGSNQNQALQDQESADQLDDVDLSSSEQQQDEENNENADVQDEEQQDQNINENLSDQDEQQEDNDDEEDLDDEESQEIIVNKNNKNSKGNTKNTKINSQNKDQQNQKPPAQSVSQTKSLNNVKNNPQKKRKLNTIY